MQYLKYSDIALVPEFSSCHSRSDCDTSIDFLGRKFKLPIVPANMQSVIDMDVSKWMSQNGYFYIMHRFGNNLREVVSQMNSEGWDVISVSMGVQMKDKKDLVAISKSNQRVDYVTIDIAHGHCERMKIAIEAVKKFLPDTKIIAGNVASPEAVRDLSEWGADSIKVGIGQGSPCTTKDKTGFTMPMFSCVEICSNFYETDSPIIADGGIVHNGDVAKALAAGASMAMAGGIFAGWADSPAEERTHNNKLHKAYFGSASSHNKGHENHIEGKLTHVSCNGMTYEEKLSEMKQDLQSSISYAGGEDLSCLKNTKYINV